MRFGPKETVQWFEQRGVRLKTESDGRMFPTTDDSQTIITCLWNAAKRAGVTIRTGARVEGLEPAGGKWRVRLAQQETLTADRLLVATGSSEAMWQLLAGLGHTIVEPVPSLFTFNVKDPRLRDLAGVSVPQADVQVEGTKLTAQGPLLVTHWGLSGPAILRLSAWGARDLAKMSYRFSIKVNWLGQLSTADVQADLNRLKQEHARKQILANPQFGLPQRLWERLATAAGAAVELRWADAGKPVLQRLATELTAGAFAINGKSTFKEEFVTAGGVDLKEVNFKTFESKLHPGLYFAGEVLDVDAITGGFNFQAAWTGGWIVGSAE
jgi:hypothetical protein